MRSARVDDTWRRLSKKKYSTKIESIEVTKLNRFQDQIIQFSGSITALCGLNGSGKSTLLNSIYLLISKSNGIEEMQDMYKRITFNKLEGILNHNNDEIKINYSKEGSFDEESLKTEINLAFLDTSYQVPSLIKRFAELKDIESLIDGSDPAVLNNEEIKHINYILGKEYSKCKIYELELDDQTFPYFRVDDNGLDYGTEDMGHGEVAALYIYWKLKNSRNNSIFLIEEPETYLSTLSQKKIMNVIAKFSLEKSLTVILTTHSSEILTKIPVQDIKLFIEDFNNRLIQLSSADDRRDYLYSLGLTPPKKGVILVEDNVAAIVLEHLIMSRIRNSDLDYEIVKWKSESEVQTALKNFPNDISWFKLYGVFDGDQKDNINSIESNIARDRFAFLPGKLPFEVQCQKIIVDHLDEFSEYSRVEKRKINEALRLINGEDIHDWLIDLCKHLRLDLSSLVKTCFDISMEVDSDFRKDENISFEDIKKFFDEN